MNIDENKIDSEIEKIIHDITVNYNIEDIQELNNTEKCLYCNSQDITDNICNECGNYNQ